MLQFVRLMYTLNFVTIHCIVGNSIMSIEIQIFKINLIPKLNLKVIKSIKLHLIIKLIFFLGINFVFSKINKFNCSTSKTHKFNRVFDMKLIRNIYL